MPKLTKKQRKILSKESKKGKTTINLSIKKIKKNGETYFKIKSPHLENQQLLITLINHFKRKHSVQND